MSIEIKGLDRLIKKVSALENLNYNEVVTKTAKIIEPKLRGKAAEHFPKSSNYLKICETRSSQQYCYVEIGLKSDTAPFDLWKEAWYHNWGYFLKYYGKPTNVYINMYAGWWNSAVNDVSEEAKEEMKRHLRESIKKALSK